MWTWKKLKISASQKKNYFGVSQWLVHLFLAKKSNDLGGTLPPLPPNAMLSRKKKVIFRNRTIFFENFSSRKKYFQSTFRGHFFVFIIARGGKGGFSKKWTRSLCNTVVSENVRRETKIQCPCNMDDKRVQATVGRSFEKRRLYL